MGKEKFEDICVQNLSAKHFGKYVSGKLKVFSTARCCTEFTESPDFLFEINNECYGVEHFVIDLLYKEQEGVQRSGSRLADSGIWEIYKHHHEALIKNQFDAKIAAKDLEKAIQEMADLVAKFNYAQYMDEFKRIVEKHAGKVGKYYENIQQPGKTKIYFLIEERNPFSGAFGKGIDCFVRRRDGALIKRTSPQTILTVEMMHVLKKYIGKIEGVIFQTYDFSDISNQMVSMIYLDMTSEKMLKSSLDAQKLTVYQDFYFTAPYVDLYLDVKN